MSFDFKRVGTDFQEALQLMGQHEDPLVRESAGKIRDGIFAIMDVGIRLKDVSEKLDNTITQAIEMFEPTQKKEEE